MTLPTTNPIVVNPGDENSGPRKPGCSWYGSTRRPARSAWAGSRCGSVATSPNLLASSPEPGSSIEVSAARVRR